MLDGLMPIVIGFLVLAILVSAAKQLYKGFRVGKFIPWLLCAAFIIYASHDLTVFESLGKSVWKVAGNLITHINVPPAK